MSDVLDHLIEKLPVGIHFAMPEETYHSIEALSASGVKNLRTSPLDYWARSVFFNPNHEEDNDGEETEARETGRAYHKRIVEGPAAFDACYASTLDASNYPDALRTVDDMKIWLHERDLPKTAKSKADYIARVLAHDPEQQIWDNILRGYEDANEGRTLLRPKLIGKIEMAARMIENHTELRKCFRDGAPEVSLFWVCHHTGIPCKARVDYLKPRSITDLKSFANQGGMPIDRAVNRFFANFRCAFQGTWYLRAAELIPHMIRQKQVHGEASPELLKGLLAGHEKTLDFVFMQKGPAPVAHGRRFRPQLGMFEIVSARIDSAKQTYRECIDHYGKDPWVDPQPMDDFTDEEVPQYATE